MNNHLVKFAAIVLFSIVVLFVVLKPIVSNESQYKVVIVNTSEHRIDSVIISGAGQRSDKIGPIKVGNLNDYIFTPSKDGVLRYSIHQNNHELTGIINDKLKKNDTGEIFVVIGEMYKVRIENEFDT